MPIHDWTKVAAGIWHDFHLSWISELRIALNNGILPPDYYALAEQITAQFEMDEYALKRRTLVIRHSSGDEIVALVEIVSPGNKSSRRAFDAFVQKAVESLFHGYHLLVIDLFPPGPRDPNGIHGAIAAELSGEPFTLPVDEPLTLAAYSAGVPKKAYVEPTAVGRNLIDMPLFLEPETYVNVPLEATYEAAYRGVPQRWRRVLESK